MVFINVMIGNYKLYINNALDYISKLNNLNCNIYQENLIISVINYVGRCLKINNNNHCQ